MELKHQLTSPLKQLRLSGILETLDARHRQAIDGFWNGCCRMKSNAAPRNN
jgi:hypothetical protein